MRINTLQFCAAVSSAARGGSTASAGHVNPMLTNKTRYLYPSALLEF